MRGCRPVISGARRQIEGCAQQCGSWSSEGGGFYARLVERTRSTGTMRAQLDKAAQAASAATAKFRRFLQTGLLPLAPERAAVGRERYARASRSSLGSAVDLDEAYAWGWAEVRRLEAEMAAGWRGWRTGPHGRAHARIRCRR